MSHPDDKHDLVGDAPWLDDIADRVLHLDPAAIAANNGSPFKVSAEEFEALTGIELADSWKEILGKGGAV